MITFWVNTSHCQTSVAVGALSCVWMKSEIATRLGSMTSVRVGEDMPSGSRGNSALLFIQEGKRSGTKADGAPVAHECPLLPPSDPCICGEAFCASSWASKGMTLSDPRDRSLVIPRSRPWETGTHAGNLVRALNNWSSELRAILQSNRGKKGIYKLLVKPIDDHFLSSKPLTVLGQSPHHHSAETT